MIERLKHICDCIHIEECEEKGTWCRNALERLHSRAIEAEAQLDAMTAQRDLYSARVGDLEQEIRALIGEVEINYEYPTTD